MTTAHCRIHCPKAFEPFRREVANRVEGIPVITTYLEHALVWQDSTSRPSAQRVAGLELDRRNQGLSMDMLRRLSGNSSFTFSLHRPLDGVMKDRTVGTISVIVRP